MSAGLGILLPNADGPVIASPCRARKPPGNPRRTREEGNHPPKPAFANWAAHESRHPATHPVYPPWPRPLRESVKCVCWNCTENPRAPPAGLGAKFAARGKFRWRREVPGQISMASARPNAPGRRQHQGKPIMPAPPKPPRPFPAIQHPMSLGEALRQSGRTHPSNFRQPVYANENSAHHQVARQTYPPED